MGAFSYYPQEREARRLHASREELIEQITHAIPKDGVIQPFKGLHLARVSTPMKKIHSVLEPSFCVIAQGSKEVLLGENRYHYDPENYLISTLDLPRASQVLDASTERPYLSFRLELDPQIVSSVMAESSAALSARTSSCVRAIDVSPLDADLLDSVVRLVRLMDCPTESSVLLPLVKREIVYRLLMGSQGARLRHLTVLGGSVPSIVRAVRRIHQTFDQPLRIEELAQEVGMSVSGFHYHFKAVTAMSPLQFQKHLRLQEARRLMLSENLDATTTAYRVGYNDPSHFSREYKSLFGSPPIRDIQQIRQAEITVVS